MEEGFINSLKNALEIDDREILLTDEFRNYKEWDSLVRLTLIAMLDEEYNVLIESADFENLITVEDLYNEVIKRISSQKS